MLMAAIWNNIDNHDDDDDDIDDIDNIDVFPRGAHFHNSVGGLVMMLMIKATMMIMPIMWKVAFYMIHNLLFLAKV